MTHSILFVDNDQNNLTALQQLFEHELLRSIYATSCTDALDILKNGVCPAVVLTDLDLLTMSGSEFLRQVKIISPESMRLMLLDSSDSAGALDALNSKGLCRYILKPWKDADLIETVKNAVHHFELAQENKRLSDMLFLKNAKLKDLNKNLEQKITERTKALEDAYQANLILTEELHQKVRELEGRDRILNHLLTIHSLENSLHTALEVICDVVGSEQATVHLAKDWGNLQKTATIDRRKHREVQCSETGSANRHFQKEKIAEVFSSGTEYSTTTNTPISIPAFAALPVMKNDTCLAVVEVHRHQKNFSSHEMKTIGRFMVHIAIAITDSMIQQDLPAWEETLDNILLDIAQEGS